MLHLLSHHSGTAYVPVQHLLIEDRVHACRGRVLPGQDRLTLHPPVYPLLHHFRSRLRVNLQDRPCVRPGLEQPGDQGMLEHLQQPCCGLVRLERAEPDGERDAPHPPLVPLERPRSPEHLIRLGRLSWCRGPVPRLDVRDCRGTDEHLRGGFFLCPPALIPHRDHFLREHAPLVVLL